MSTTGGGATDRFPWHRHPMVAGLVVIVVVSAWEIGFRLVVPMLSWQQRSEEQIMQMRNTMDESKKAERELVIATAQLEGSVKKLGTTLGADAKRETSFVQTVSERTPVPRIIGSVPGSSDTSLTSSAIVTIVRNELRDGLNNLRRGEKQDIDNLGDRVAVAVDSLCEKVLSAKEAEVTSLTAALSANSKIVSELHNTCQQQERLIGDYKVLAQKLGDYYVSAERRKSVAGQLSSIPKSAIGAFAAASKGNLVASGADADVWLARQFGALAERETSLCAAAYR